MTFGAYPTMPFRSGAYLFKTDFQRPENVPVFEADTLREAVIVSGTVFSELSLVYEGPKTSSFVHTVRLYHGIKGTSSFLLLLESKVLLLLTFSDGAKRGGVGGTKPEDRYIVTIGPKNDFTRYQIMCAPICSPNDST